MSAKLAAEMQRNFEGLQSNPYPGRGIIVGWSDDEHLTQVYWIMGRSFNSQNRVFEVDNKTKRLYTEAADPAKVEDPSLIIYNAMRESGNHYIVSNGDQTDTIAEHSDSYDLQEALVEREYEPDEPNYTPRISAVTTVSGNGGASVRLSILRKPENGDGCERELFEYAPCPGTGRCLTTYKGDGNPLPSFTGEPLLLPLVGGGAEIADRYWAALNEDNRVSLAVKTISPRSGHSYITVRNRFEMVG